MKFLPFAKPDITESEIEEVVDSLQNGWLTTGPKASKFESDFKAFFNDPLLNIFAVSSATAGLHLALEACGVGPGDEVITTTHTFTATAEVIRYVGATPVFVDIDATTLCIDVDKVKERITSKTKCIIPVHFAGLPAEMDRLLGLAAEHNIRVIEDAAHAFPSKFKGEYVGALNSDVTVFSFYANKTMTTGEGGLVITRSESIAKRVSLMRLHGIDRNAFDRYVSTSPSWKYEVLAAGYKYNMPDILASIGIQQLKRVEQMHIARTQIAIDYNKMLTGLPIKKPPMPNDSGTVHSWHLYVIQLEENLDIGRDEFIAKMSALGVGCSVHYIPLHEHTYWRTTCNLSQDMFPVSSSVYRNCVSLPIYSSMTEKDVAKVVSAIRTILC